MKKLSVALVTTSKALVPSSFFVITSKAPVTTSVALVPSSNDGRTWSVLTFVTQESRSLGSTVKHARI